MDLSTYLLITYGEGLLYIKTYKGKASYLITVITAWHLLGLKMETAKRYERLLRMTQTNRGGRLEMDDSLVVRQNVAKSLQPQNLALCTFSQSSVEGRMRRCSYCEQDKLLTYKRNTEACSHNIFCCGRAINTTYYDCVCV